jgi:endonuclease YncB( thermonuclease family)
MKQKKTAIKIGAATAAVAAATLLFVTFENGKKIQTPAYTVKQVLDGDSLYLNNGLEIRLANIDAPEMPRCGGPEAKNALERLVLGKPIYIYIITEDKFHRFISMVYTDKTFINAEMLRLGQATYPSTTTGFQEILKNAHEEAIAKRRGIHGPPCTQRVNTDNPSCTIKGNNKDGKKYYYASDCGFYNQALVQLYEGDQWFCTEDEAQEAGYQKAPRCL